MNSITTILSFIKICDYNVDKALYEYIKTQNITLEEFNIINKFNMDDKYFIEFKNKLRRFIDDNLFITDYLLAHNPNIDEYIEKKYEISYSNGRKFPYGIEYARKLSHTILGRDKDIIEQYINGYIIYYKNRKREEKVKRKK